MDTRLSLSPPTESLGTRLTCPIPSSWKVSLHFVELQFIVKGHQPNALLGCILDVGDLLAGVSIDDPLGRDPQTKDGPDLVLEETQSRTVE